MVRNIAAVGLAMAFAAVALAGGPGRAQQRDDVADYPNRTVRIICSAAAGGGLDTIVRHVADKLQRRFGQRFAVENKPGLAGNVGAEAVYQAEHDGYTLLAAQPAPLTTNALMYKKLNFDPAAFEPVVIMSSQPAAMVVRPNLPVNSVAELIAYAKAHPGMTYGSQGVGTRPHLAGELLAHMTGADLTHVPYRGTPQAVADVVAGHVDMLIILLDAVRPQYEANRLKLLAVASAERFPALPAVPTLIESGLPDFLSDTWQALVAPPRTPKAITTMLNAAVREIMREPDTRAQLARMNMTAVPGSPADTAAFIGRETKRWGAVIRAANITAN